MNFVDSLDAAVLLSWLVKALDPLSFNHCPPNNSDFSLYHPNFVVYLENTTYFNVFHTVLEISRLVKNIISNMSS